MPLVHVPDVTRVVPQTPALHVAFWHAAGVGQSLAFTHPTHWPLALHTIADPHAVSTGRFDVPQTPLLQAAAWHAAGAGQLLAVTHPTQWPLPSHTDPDPHAVPAARFDVPQTPPLHVAP